MSEHVEVPMARVRFYSEGDEEAFFVWMRSAGLYEKILFKSDVMVLRLKKDEVSDDLVREILALFKRYRIGMAPLSRLQGWVGDWFLSPQTYWHDEVFAYE